MLIGFQQNEIHRDLGNRGLTKLLDAISLNSPTHGDIVQLKIFGAAVIQQVQHSNASIFRDSEKRVLTRNGKNSDATGHTNLEVWSDIESIPFNSLAITRHTPVAAWTLNRA